MVAGLFLFAGCSASPAVENRTHFDFQTGTQSEISSVEPFVTEQARHAFWRSCASCHGYDGRGIMAVGPDLRRAKRRGADEWERYLRDSSGAHPAGQQPPLWVNGDELTAVAAYVDALSRESR